MNEPRYFMIETENNNGFPEMKASVISNDLETMRKRLVGLAKVYLDKMLSEDLDELHIDRESCYVTDSKGNGFAAEILEENKVLQAIMQAVDNSKVTSTFSHCGDTDYTIKVPFFKVPFFNLCNDVTGEPISICVGYTDEEGDKYVPKYIIRRPYDTENKDDEEYIYDVNCDLYSKGEKEPIDFVIPLEELAFELLYQIYCIL